MAAGLTSHFPCSLSAVCLADIFHWLWNIAILLSNWGSTSCPEHQKAVDFRMWVWQLGHGKHFYRTFWWLISDVILGYSIFLYMYIQYIHYSIEKKMSALNDTCWVSSLCDFKVLRMSKRKERSAPAVFLFDYFAMCFISGCNCCLYLSYICHPRTLCINHSEITSRCLLQRQFILSSSISGAPFHQPNKMKNLRSTMWDHMTTTWGWSTMWDHMTTTWGWSTMWDHMTTTWGWLKT